MNDKWKNEESERRRQRERERERGGRTEKFVWEKKNDFKLFLKCTNERCNCYWKEISLFSISLYYQWILYEIDFW